MSRLKRKGPAICLRLPVVLDVAVRVRARREGLSVGVLIARMVAESVDELRHDDSYAPSRPRPAHPPDGASAV